MADLSEMERELLAVVGKAFAYCHEPILRAYLSEAIAWAVAHRRWRDDLDAAIARGWDAVLVPDDPQEETEAVLRAFLRGE